MDAATWFGLAALVVCALSLSAGSAPLQKISTVLFVSWVVSNIVSGTTTPPRLLVFNSLSDLVGLSLCVSVLIRNTHKRLLLALILLYLAMITFHCAWLWYRIPVFAPYFTALNVLFAAQLAAVGASGVWAICVRFGDRLRGAFTERLHLPGSRNP